MVSHKQILRRLIWVGTSRKDLKKFPDDVRSEIGYALYKAQCGEKHINAKPLKGFGGATVLEIVDDFDTDTYRAVYTVKFQTGIYVLHAFQKKSKRGNITLKSDMELIKRRLREAGQIHKEKLSGGIIHD